MRLLVSALLLFIISTASAGGADRQAIHGKAEDVQPLLPGMVVPAFELRDAAGEIVAFDPSSVQKPLVITFFRGGWCPYCNLHLAELRKAEAELKGMGFELWFISMDRPELLYESLEQPDIGYRVLSDTKLHASRAFGIAFRVDDETVERLLGWDIDLEGASGEEHHVLPAPATFIVGPDGAVQFQYTNPDYKRRLHPDVLLAAARVYNMDVEDRLIRERKARK